MARSINEQMDFLEPLPRNLITGDAELTEPLPNPNAPEYEQMRKAFSKDVGKGIITSPVTGAADTVEAGKMLPELDDKVKPFAPTYTGIEAAFEKLYNLGINRKTAEKAIKDVTGIKLEGTAGEFTGELVGLPAIAATKAVNAIASSAAKYGMEAPKAVSRISTEAKKLFSDAGGFDDLATATAGSTRGQTRKMLDKRPLPDTSITKIIIGQSGKDYDKKVASYNKAKQQLIPGKNRVDDQDAQELWNRTGAQEDVIDNDIVYEIPTAKARLKLKESDIFDYKEGRASFDPKNEVTLKDILDFDELYKQAPYLKNVQVKRLNGFQRLQGTKAAYNPESNTIFIASGSPTNLTSDLLHEVEHAVQEADGKAFAGGNFRKILRADSEYNKLGGADGKRELKKAEDDIIKKYGGKVSGKKEIVRNFLRTYRKIPDPKKFIDTVRALPKITKTDRRLGANITSVAHAGVFRYMKDVDEFMDNQFPEINYEYTSQIIDTLIFIRDSSPKRIKSILSDIQDKKIMDLKKFNAAEKRAVLKYLRDPGEVTARNVQFRFLTSKKDPSITRVAPRLTEDRYARLGDEPFDVTKKPPTKSAEQLSKEAAEKGVSLTDEGYYLASKAEQTGGDAAQSLGKQTDNMISVFPKPERMFPEGQRPKGGDYLNPQTGEVLSGRNVSSANIKINPDGRPAFKVSDDNIEEVGSVGKGKSNIRVNLFKKKAGWKWDSAPDEYKDIGTLVSVEHKGKHFYTLETDFSKGVTLKKYPDSKTEPRLRPTVVGSIEMGEPVGSISVRGKKHPVYGKITTFNKGGAVPMNNMAKQMELFDEGGLMDEGGTIDPVSGNDVPPGSTQEEVRDDIPAQLSEGEFVFPADVVRFIGLEKLMKIRQRAKAGLKMMEEMGQMGNSEEAIIPDDLPFSIDDLDMEDDGLEMNVGGLVGSLGASLAGNITPMPGGSPGGPIGSFNPRIPGQTGMNPNIGTAPAPMQAASSGGVDPNLGGTAFTPTNVQPIQQTFQQAVGAGVPGVDFEYVEYVNESGQIVRLRRNKNTGEMLDPIPEGFTQKTDATQTQTATGTGVQTAKVVDDGDGGAGDEGIQSTASVTLGGISGTGRQKGLRVGDYKTFGVSYNVPGGLPGMAGAFSTVAGLAFGKGLPENATATIFDRDFPKASITVSAKDFNAMKALDYKGELAEAYKDALNITAGVLDNKVTINENGQIVDGKGNPVSDRTQGLVQRAVVGSVLDNVKTSVPGFLDSINNFGKVSFEEAVANANDAQRSVLDNMGVDYDPSLEVTAAEKADMARQEEKALAEALARANQARENKAAADRAAKARIDYDILQGQMRDAFEASDGQDDNVGAGADVGTGGEEDTTGAGPSAVGVSDEFGDAYEGG